MVAALELQKAGYKCRILEARSRAGGRNWTLRSGDAVDEIGSAQQRSCWDPEPNMYFNAGPARIPHHHVRVLNYCLTLNVPVEVIVDEDRNAYLFDKHAFSGKRQVARSIVNDARGFVAEMAAKAVAKNVSDAPLSAEDTDLLLSYGAPDRVA
jgi:monoamine oxidase